MYARIMFTCMHINVLCLFVLIWTIYAQDDKEMMASLKNLRNNDNQGLSKAAQGAYFVIDEGKDRQKGTNYKILALLCILH